MLPFITIYTEWDCYVYNQIYYRFDVCNFTQVIVWHTHPLLANYEPLLSTNITAGFIFCRLYFTEKHVFISQCQEVRGHAPLGSPRCSCPPFSRLPLTPVAGAERPAAAVLMAPRGKGCFHESATGDEPSDKKKQNEGAIGHRGSYYHIGPPERKLWRRLTRCKRDVRCFHSNKVNTLTAGVTAYQMDF